MNKLKTMELRDVYDFIKSISLKNITAFKRYEINLCSEKMFFYGNKKKIFPIKVMVGVIETKSGISDFGIIVNQFMLTTLNDAFFVKIDEDISDVVIVGYDLINVKDFPYEEHEIKFN